VLLPHTVCNALVVGGRRLGAEQQAMRPAAGYASGMREIVRLSRTISLIPDA